jgi:hypothetical protein
MRASAEWLVAGLLLIGCAEPPAQARAPQLWSGPLAGEIAIRPSTCLQMDSLVSRCSDGDTLRVSTVEFERASRRVRSLIEITLHEPAVAESVFRARVAAREADRGPGTACSSHHVQWTPPGDSVHAVLILNVTTSSDTLIRWRWRLVDRQQLAPLDSAYTCDSPLFRAR